MFLIDIAEVTVVIVAIVPPLEVEATIAIVANVFRRTTAVVVAGLPARSKHRHRHLSGDPETAENEQRCQGARQSNHEQKHARR